jgi:heptaprenyl diphosphate synthase
MNSSKNHFLTQFENRLSNILSWDQESSNSAEPTLFAAARHLCLAGGKRARPKLTYFFSKALDLECPEILDIAIAAEFIHNASLLHDDVIDHGTLRRGSPTANVVWDDLTAVLAGDILLAESIQILNNCPRIVAQEALSLVSSMTKATMLEAHIRNKINVSTQEWEFIADGKTSSMFRWCGRAIGHLGNNADATTRFGLFGTHFGLAFQMADDVLDMQHSDGKTPFADLRNKNPNYPIIKACQLSNGIQKDLETLWAQETVSETGIQQLGQAICSSGAIEHCVERINQEVQLSIEALGAYAQKPGCQEISMWALAMCHRFQRSEAV